ncbi:MAG TPA: peptidoglycan DD-metalloendopeptidase family protein [Chroococcidiopsis sp.]
MAGATLVLLCAFGLPAAGLATVPPVATLPTVPTVPTIPSAPSTLALASPGSAPLLAQASPSVNDLRQQQRRIEQQKNQIDQQQRQLQNLEEAARQRLDGLQDHIEVTSDRIAENERQLAIANQRLKDLESDLAKAEQTFQQRQFATVARLRFLQRQQGGEGWAVLLQSKSLNEFLDRRRQLKLVYHADRDILAGLKTQADDLEKRRRNVQGQKNEIALLTQQLQAEKAQYQAQATTQSGLINRLRENRQALEAAENQLEQDSSNLSRLIQQRLAAQDRNSVVVNGTGQFSFPSSGRITSRFGYRIHPILGYRRFHAGVDFGASHGSTIRAADSGTVIFAGWYGGYGRAVVISHGGGVTTLYAHTSQIFVSEGETVQRGQAIAAVGATGLATGPHLHFEVRVNGNPVDPMGYL